MNNRKNIKVIDEHGFERSANIVCGIDVDGTDYVLYSIKRDDENDNLFISKLIKNTDGTSNMINIDDTMEKSMLSDIVKELVTYAINSDSDRTTGTVTLSNGRGVLVSGVLFNREQSINVGKTYVTTVKRTVTKVSENFYYVEFAKPEPVVESVFDSSISADSVFPESTDSNFSVLATEPRSVDSSFVQPVVSENVVGTPEVSSNLDMTTILPDANTTPSVPFDNVVTTPVTPVMPSVDTVSVYKPSVQPSVVSEPVSMPEPVVAQPVIEPILPEVPTVSDSVASVIPEVNNVQSSVQPLTPKTEEFFIHSASVPEQSSVVSDVQTPAVSSNTELVFDGSRETNLNDVLGEVSKDNVLPVQDVAPIMEFGHDEVSTSMVNNLDNTVVPDSSDSSSTAKSGFASNKFFMVVAVAFFLAACVFLGYEVFRYFKMVG